MSFSSEDTNELIFKLVGATSPKFDIDSIMEITLNSPLGNAVYGKKVGETASYSVDGGNILVLIKDITKENTITNDDGNQRSK